MPIVGESDRAGRQIAIVWLDESGYSSAPFLRKVGRTRGQLASGNSFKIFPSVENLRGNQEDDPCGGCKQLLFVGRC
jgi:hypothetical protein